MNKYRFKTQDEFIRDGQWDDDNHCPLGWSLSGDMNHYLGQDVPEGANESCDLGEGFGDDGWWFQHTNYVLKEEDYTGRWIKALVDSPQCTGVKAGEVIKIIAKPSSYRLDKTSNGCVGMGIEYPLNTSQWELVEEPKDDFDDILEKARKLYSIGTEFISNLGSFSGHIETVKAELNWYNENKDSISHSGIGWVYFDGKWAEIVKPASSKDVPEYVKCIEVPEGWKLTKKGTIYKTDKYSGGTYRIIYHEEGGGQTTVGKEHCFVPATKQEYDAQFTNEQDPLYICKQKYRKGMRVRSAAKEGIYSGEFIIKVDPKEFRNLSGNKEIVDYSCSDGYLYYNGEYAKILEETPTKIPWAATTSDSMVGVTKSNIINYGIGVDAYLESTSLSESSPEAYNWLMNKSEKPSIETVHSVDVNLRTKKQINKFKF